MSPSVRDLIIQVFSILLQIAGIILVPIVIMAIQTYLSHLEAQIGKTNYEKYAKMIKDIVYAVEQLHPELLGADKYKYAIYAINEKLGNILTEKEMNTLIEAAVAEINLLSKGTIKKSIT
jgi:hypothetical protein